MDNLDERQVYKAIYEGVYDAFIDALGRNGQYPFTTEAILQAIKTGTAEAIEQSEEIEQLSEGRK